jgi:hypothetical protein
MISRKPSAQCAEGFSLQKAAIDSMLNSSQLLRNLSQSFIDRCNPAVAVRIGQAISGKSYIFELIDGEVTLFSSVIDSDAVPRRLLGLFSPS